MDQINTLKGYGKVTHLEDQNPPPPPSKPKSLLIAVAISAVILSTLFIGLIIGASLHQKPTVEISSSSNLTDSIKFVCNFTHYPDTCLSSINSLFNTSPEFDPELILKHSLQVSFIELSKLSVWLKNLTLNAGDGGASSALEDCGTQIEDAIGRVNDSVVEMEDKIMLTESKISDIQTWVSSALTDEQSCLDGLQEMDSTFFDEVKMKMTKSIEFLSNTLAILANIKIILLNFNMPLH